LYYVNNGFPQITACRWCAKFCGVCFGGIIPLLAAIGILSVMSGTLVSLFIFDDQCCTSVSNILRDSEELLAMEGFL
jgi:hypothetical protein